MVDPTAAVAAENQQAAEAVQAETQVVAEQAAEERQVERVAAVAPHRPVAA